MKSLRVSHDSGNGTMKGEKMEGVFLIIAAAPARIASVESANSLHTTILFHTKAVSRHPSAHF